MNVGPVGAGSPQRPPASQVLVDASNPVWAGRILAPPMFIEFVPGWRFHLSPGRNVLALPPGRYHAQLFSQYTFFRVGRAELVIDARPGRTVLVHYVAPYTIYSRGRAGYGALPNGRPGLGALLAIFALAAVIPLLALMLGLVLRVFS